MDLALWIVAGVLAAIFLLAGIGKLVVPKDRIASFGENAHWVHDFSARSVKGIGALEVMAAFGLILPAALDIVPVLVPLAALGLVLIMAGAVWTRVRRREAKAVIPDFVYLSLAAFVAWGRFGPESFTG